MLAPSQWHSLCSNFKIMAHSLSIAQQQGSNADVWSQKLLGAGAGVWEQAAIPLQSATGCRPLQQGGTEAMLKPHDALQDSALTRQKSAG